MVSLSILIIDKGIKPALMLIAEQKTTEFATRAINAAVKFAGDYNFDDLITITTNNEGDITTYGWNSAVVSKVNRISTDRVEEFFKYMNDGNRSIESENIAGMVDEWIKEDPTVVEIPIGQAIGSTLLANLGPKIPVNLELTGSVKTDVIREVEEIGINGALVTIYIIVEAEVQIIIPLTSEVKPVSSKIYIDSGVIMGAVPDYYGGKGDGPSISVPKDSFGSD
jgi:sporulation protein YunB